MKPDVLAQIKVIEEERAEMLRKANEELAAKNATGPIMLQRPGEAPKELSQHEVLTIMQQQHATILQLTNKIQELEKTIIDMQVQIIEKQTVNPENVVVELDKKENIVLVEKPKTETPQITVQGD
jgi:hypothetical protein